MSEKITAHRHAEMGPLHGGGHAFGVAVEEGPDRYRRARKSWISRRTKIANAVREPLTGASFVEASASRRGLSGKGAARSAGAAGSLRCGDRRAMSRASWSRRRQTRDDGGRSVRRTSDGTETPSGRLRLCCERRAKAIRVVFIHGFGGDLNNWLFNIDAVTEVGIGLRA